MSTEISISSNPQTDDKENVIGTQNEDTIKMLYKALSQGETETVSSLIASDLEYWFHGPPRCHHMMRVLTGESPSHTVAFCFEPRSVTAVGGECVIAEGWEGAKAYWVHVWMVKGSVVTQFREYFNTWLTVQDLRPPPQSAAAGHRQSFTTTLWQSMPRDLFRRSLPGLLLAI